jgi:hypothetical protein
MGQTRASTSEATELVQVLTSAGERANAHNFARAFGFTMLYAVGALVLVFLGMFGLPRHGRTRDLDAEFALMSSTDSPDPESGKAHGGALSLSSTQ